MVQDQSFSGLENEDPHNHLTKFEQLCSCLTIDGMTQETLKWKLFPFSLLGRAKQWYAHSVRGVNGNWDELRDKFCHTFFPLSKIAALHREILNFEQKEKETLGAAWARFISLTNSGPTHSLPENILSKHFYLGLNKEAALHLDSASRGSFLHKTINEGQAILEKTLENTPYTSIFDEFPKEEKVVEPSPKPQDEEHTTELDISIDSSNNLVVEKPPIEGMQTQLEDDERSPLEFPFEFKEDIFEDYGISLNCLVQVRPQEKTTPIELH